MAGCSVEAYKKPQTGVPVLPGAAIEFADSAFHLFARRVRRRTHALNAKPELVGVRSAHQRFFQRDQSAGIEIVDRLIESLHAVLASSSRNGVADAASLIRIHDAIANESSSDHYLDGWHAPSPIPAPNQALANHRPQSAGKLQANLLLLRRRKHSNDALNRFG